MPRDQRVNPSPLPTDELFDDEFEEDDAELEDEDMVAVDVHAITRLSYARGFINTLSDLRRGRDLQITEWLAPHIPQIVLDSLELEQFDLLEGRWGAPKAGEPIQIDLIDIETEDDLISIEVFNRALVLADLEGEDVDEEMRRIERVCTTLERAIGQASPLPHAPEH